MGQKARLVTQDHDTTWIQVAFTTQIDFDQGTITQIDFENLTTKEPAIANKKFQMASKG